MTSNLVIVESPAKANTIAKYLGHDYTVLASYGHVRDLPPKDGSVRPDEDFTMDWELGERAARAVNAVIQAAKTSNSIFLATDPDREGEAIAWHINEILRGNKSVKADTIIRRVTFNAITKKSVTDAIKAPRDIDNDLVDAYKARRALDYLVGFSLSPVLWRKLPGSRSAGRVQSVALRLVCERESEIERFKPQEFWTIEAIFATEKGEVFPARLTHLSGNKLDKFALPNEAAAVAARTSLDNLSWNISSIDRRQVRRNPWPPFTTSTLQQEASRRLGLGASRTMRLAQQLYEGIDIGGEVVGLITYMRTDGVSLADEAIASARSVIGRDFGADFLPDSPRIYKTASKNAQEAHEAIRPTDMNRKPEAVARFLDSDARALYTLIWQRAIASQMASAVLDQVALDIATQHENGVFRATGSTVVFEGWMRAWRDDRDEDKPDADSGTARLPAVKQGESVAAKSITPEGHETQPPPRYSEATLVKKLEELGIGRPSTYASILQVLQDRNYVRIDKKRFIPEDRGRLVTSFLENFFSQWVAYDFTADLENRLDDISGGRVGWKKVMRDFWDPFTQAITTVSGRRISEVIDALDSSLGEHFFPPRSDKADPRQCPSCSSGRLGLRLGKFGAFLACSNYPECRHTTQLAVKDGEAATGAASFTPKILGTDPVSGLPVSVRVGPWGSYVQLGPAANSATVASHNTSQQDEKTTEQIEHAESSTPQTKPKRKTKADKPVAEKPKRASLPKGMDPNLVNFDTAIGLLNLPREIGKYPENGETIIAGIGRFGSYLKVGSRYVNLAGDDDVLTIGLNRAVSLIAEAASKAPSGRAGAGRQIGVDPQESKPITVHAGRYGPYVKWKSIMATIPKDSDPETITVEDAVALIAAKVAKSSNAGGAGAAKSAKGSRYSRTAKSSAAKSSAAKPSAVKRSKTNAKQKKELTQINKGRYL